MTESETRNWNCQRYPDQLWSKSKSQKPLDTFGMQITFFKPRFLRWNVLSNFKWFRKYKEMAQSYIKAYELWFNFRILVRIREICLGNIFEKLQGKNKNCFRKFLIEKYKKYKIPHKIWKLLNVEGFRCLSVLFTQKFLFSSKMFDKRDQ